MVFICSPYHSTQLLFTFIHVPVHNNLLKKYMCGHTHLHKRGRAARPVCVVIVPLTASHPRTECLTPLPLFNRLVPCLDPVGKR